MTVINTNTAATITANALSKNERAMTQAMERLSTGQRINSAGDDAAGLAISSKMTSQISGLNQAVRNANDAISQVQTEEGAMIEVSNMLQRMRTLAVQSSSDTNTSTDRAALDVEFTALASEMQRIGANTQWNGSDLLDGVSTTYFSDGKIQISAEYLAGKKHGLEIHRYENGQPRWEAVYEEGKLKTKLRWKRDGTPSGQNPPKIL